jgi:hypothetical protein
MRLGTERDLTELRARDLRQRDDSGRASRFSTHRSRGQFDHAYDA